MPRRCVSRCRLWGLLLTLAMTAAACEQPRTAFTFHNDSNEAVLMVSATEGMLDETLAASSRWTLIPPGVSRVRSSSGISPDYCDNEVRAHYVLRPLRELDLDGNNEASVSADDFEILEIRGPGHCWGERRADWRYDGE